MRARERQGWIADLIAREGRVTVEHLAHELSVSAETIRRDLGLLDEKGVVKKVHGGALRRELRREGSFAERTSENVEAKRIIARKLFDLIEDGATLLIDTGSTTLACAEALAASKKLTVITNSARIAAVFGAHAGRHSVFLLGGQFASDNAETLGPMTISQVQEFQADYALISPAAVDSRAGITNADYGEASVARAMIGQAERLVVTVDQSKFEKRAAHLVGRLDAIDVLVCDELPSEHMLQRLHASAVMVR